MNVETIVLTDKSLIKRITGEKLSEIHLYLDHKCCQVYYSNLEVVKWLPYYYKIKNMIKEN